MWSISPRPAGPSGGLDAQRKRLKPANKGARRPRRLAREFDGLNSVKQRLEQDTHLQPCQVQAKALVGTRAKGQMAIGRARRVEAPWILKLRRIVVSADIVDHHPVALADELAAHLHVLSSGAHEVLHRAGPADRLFNDAGQERASACSAPAVEALVVSCPAVATIM